MTIQASPDVGRVKCPRCGHTVGVRVTGGLVEIRHKGLGVWAPTGTMVECPGRTRERPCRYKLQVG